MVSGIAVPIKGKWPVSSFSLYKGGKENQ